MKYLKRIILVSLLLVFAIFIGGCIKYNIGLKKYINQGDFEIVKNETEQKLNRGELHFVGTVHDETENIKRDDIYHYIDSISPSVILYESGKKRVKKIVKRRDYLSQFMDGIRNHKKVEKPVTLKYLNYHPDCIVLAYEWEEMDRYRQKHQLSTRPGEMINAIIRLDKENKLTAEQSKLVDDFLVLNKALVQLDNHATVYDINNSATDSIIENRQKYIYQLLPEIVNSQEELSEYKDFLPIHTTYWDKRNKIMVQNILKQIKLHPNKRIVILNGFYHRYYLIRELRKYEDEYGFTVK